MHWFSALILQCQAGQFAGKTFPNQPSNPERCCIIAEPTAMDVRYAVPIGIRAADLRRVGKISSQAIKGGQAGPLSDQYHDHPRSQGFADLVSQSDPGAARDDRSIDFDAVDSQSRNKASHDLDGMSIDRGCRQAVADDHGEPARPVSMAQQRIFRSLIEPATEIGAPQIVGALARAAAHLY